MENIKNIPVYKSDEVADAIYATADKLIVDRELAKK